MEITQYDLQVPIRTSHLAVLRRQVENICEQHGVPRLTTRRMILAIDEALTNIIVHGKINPQEQVEVKVEIDNDQIIAEFQDPGIPFDPSLDRGGPDPKSFPHRGFGLYLIHLIVDEVKYERTPDGRNVFKMFKTLH